MRRFVTLVVFGASLATVSAGGGEEERAKVLGALGASRHTLADGIRQAGKAPQAAISAKFELDGKGGLSLSVYTVAKGLGTDAENNILKELGGSPSGEQWTPKVEIFEDVRHVSRASQQLTLLALSRFSLLDILAKAEKRQAGKAYAITPVLRDRRPVFVVLFASDGKSAEVDLDLLTGEPVRPTGE